MKSVQEIRAEFAALKPEEIAKYIEVYHNDNRKGVQSILLSARKKMERYHQEAERLEGLLQFEHMHPEAEYICGIDEVGRGPLAGPVVAGAVILPKDCRIMYINDSKKLSPQKRKMLDQEIREKAVAVGIGIVSQDVIDEINILQATYEAMRQAISNLKVQPDLLLNDAVHIPEVDIPQVSIIKGDARSMSIAAASIVAKVFRDHMMEDYDKIYPGYHFASNKGYGSRDHMDAIRELGMCPIHRKTFVHE